MGTYQYFNRKEVPLLVIQAFLYLQAHDYASILILIEGGEENCHSEFIIKPLLSPTFTF